MHCRYSQRVIVITSLHASHQALRAAELLTGEAGAGGEGLDLLVAHVAGAPAEAAVRVEPDLLGLEVLEHSADAVGHVLGRLGVERLDVDEAGAELAALQPLAGLVD